MSSSFPPPIGPSDTLRDRTWNTFLAIAVMILPGTLRLMGVAEPDIDDLLQDILLATYQSLDRFDPCYSSPERDPAAAGEPACDDGPRQRHGAETRWLLGITWRQVSHYLHRAHRRHEVLSGLLTASSCFQSADPAPSGEQRIAERQRRELNIEVLAGIDPERRILLVLHEAHEVPIVDIAAALEINYNTACTRLRLGREDYRAAVRRMRPEQRRALRDSWLLFPFASEFLIRHDDLEEAAPPPPWLAPSGLLPRLVRLGRALGWMATGAAGGVALLLALEPPPPLWARRFGPTVAELFTARAVQPVKSIRQDTPAPQPIPPAPQALPRCEVAARATPVGAWRDTLAEEDRLLTAAQEALTGGDLAQALQRLAAHEARFPTGRLRFARERLRKVVESRLAVSEQNAASATKKEPSR